MLIRNETVKDFAPIRRVHIAAFANQPHSKQTEHLIVDLLRGAGVLRVSLVAEIEGEVVGHVACSPAWIEERDSDWYVLGPVGVQPEFQRQGIGKGLIEAGLQALRDRCAQGCVLVGEPDYYCRFGFRPAPELVLEGIPAEYFLCLPMAGTIPHGVVTHHSAFAVQA